MKGHAPTTGHLTDDELAELTPNESAAVLAMREAFAPVERVAADYRRRGYRSQGRLVRRCGDELGGER